MERIKYIVNIVIIALLLGAVAISKDDRVAGTPIDELGKHKESVVEEKMSQNPVEQILRDGTLVIDSKTLASDVIGFGGQTPVKLYVNDGIIERVEVAENSETPSFLEMLTDKDFYNTWDGMTLEEAATKSVDAISGATYSSNAITRNVQSAAQYGANVDAAHINPFSHFGLKDIIGVLVILLGMAISFIRPKNRAWEWIQMVLNVVVLGFWCCSFISLSQLVAWAANGVTVSLSALLLIVVIVMPLLGRRGSYCHLLCPMGSAQQLLGALPLPKLKIGVEATKFLNNLRYYILVALLFMMWLGVGFDLMNYEIFSAFLLDAASTAVLIMAAIFLLLSIFIPRPYCRFACPTGALITMSQLSNKK